MFYQVIRNNQYLQGLKALLTDIYDIDVINITEAKRGFFGETWTAETPKCKYFIKIDFWNYHKEIYRKSFSVVEYINSCGIDYILKIIKTKTGELFTRFNGGIMGVFEFFDGENSENYPIHLLFNKLALIYKLSINSVEIEKETFDATVINKFYMFKDTLSENTNKTASQIISLFKDKTDLINKYANRLYIFSDHCKTNLDGFCITHGDAGGNCIINKKNFIIVDWDYPKLAPPERDAWFFMWDTKQTDIINKLLKENNIDYTLDKNRFCYYCYYSFFYYLTEYLQAYFSVSSITEKQVFADELVKYFDSWIFRHLHFADNY